VGVSITGLGLVFGVLGVEDLLLVLPIVFKLHRCSRSHRRISDMATAIDLVVAGDFDHHACATGGCPSMPLHARLPTPPPSRRARRWAVGQVVDMNPAACMAFAIDFNPKLKAPVTATGLGSDHLLEHIEPRERCGPTGIRVTYPRSIVGALQIEPVRLQTSGQIHASSSLIPSAAHVSTM